MRSVSIVGTGRLGSALAIALARAGYAVDNLFFRSTYPEDAVLTQFAVRPEIAPLESTPEISSDVILLSTQDTEIEAACAALSGRTRKGSILHTSGSLSSEILAALKTPGVHIGSLHPLVSVSEPIAGSRRFKGSYFCVEGDEQAQRVGELIASDLGGHSFSIAASKKPLYHAAAVMASGHLVALIDTSISVLEQCGITRAEASSVIFPLIESTIQNLETQTTENALTGTFARADRPAFARHLTALSSNVDENTVDIYLELALRSLDIAARAGVSADKIDDLRNEVFIAKSGRGC